MTKGSLMMYTTLLCCYLLVFLAPALCSAETLVETGCSGQGQRQQLQQQHAAISCQDLCKRASGMECFKGAPETWEEAGQGYCSIHYPSPSSGAAGAKRGRMRYDGVFTVPKDMLLSLITRVNEAKVMRALGAHVGVGSNQAWPPSELGFFISLSFPRVSIAWEWLNGRRRAMASACCSPECHWEEMLKAPRLPSLQQLLAKAVLSADDMALGSNAHCSLARHKQGYSVPPTPLARAFTHHQSDAAVAPGADAVPTSCTDTVGFGASREEWAASGAPATGGSGSWATPMVTLAARSIQDASARPVHKWCNLSSVGQLLLWLLAPNLLVARELLGLAAVRPWLALYLCNAAVLLTGAEWISLAAPCLHPASIPARTLLAATYFLFTFVVVAASVVGVTLLGALGAWMPVLQPAVLVLAWGVLLAMPLLASLFVLVVLIRHVRVELLDALEAISRVPQLVGAVPPDARGPWAPLAAGEGGTAAAPAAAAGAAGPQQGGRPAEEALAEGQEPEGRGGALAAVAAGQEGRRRAGTLPGLAGQQQLMQRLRSHQLLQQRRQQHQQLAQAQQRLQDERLVLAPWHDESPAWHDLGPLGLVTHYLARVRGLAQGLRGSHQLGSDPPLTPPDPSSQPPLPAPTPGQISISSTLAHSASRTSAAIAAAVAATGVGQEGGTASAPSPRRIEGGGGTGTMGSRSGGAASVAARQSAAAAALAAIHWPPPLVIPPWLEERHTIPSAFKCPITLSMMREPAQASSGVTYEKSAIFQWLSVHRVDPVTQAPLKRHRLTPNLNLRNMVDEWVATCQADYLASNNASANSASAANAQSSAASNATSSTNSAAEEEEGGCREGAQEQEQACESRPSQPPSPSPPGLLPQRQQSGEQGLTGRQQQQQH